MPPPLLFLYGTLRRGESAYRALALDRRLHFVGPSAVRGGLFDLGAYPAFVTGERLVHGELFEPADATVLADLDAFEDFDPADPDGSLYLRETIRLDGDPRDAVIYRYNRSVTGFREIASGDWIAHRIARASAG